MVNIENARDETKDEDMIDAADLALIEIVIPTLGPTAGQIATRLVEHIRYLQKELDRARDNACPL